MEKLRRPAVAGLFYPAESSELRARVHQLLAAAPKTPKVAPKALIVPHAGYTYSGAAAAATFARLAPARERVRRVVLIGPAHRTPVSGLALPTCRGFHTPLGRVPLDGAGCAAARALAHVVDLDAAHENEHCLEVQLPFLQVVLADFAIVPLLAGDASPGVVARVLDALWGGPETAIVISSDLSHYHDAATAARLDGATASAIEAFDANAITTGRACGRVGIGGLLEVARRRGLRVERTTLTHSGVVSGETDQVVGYGGWVFTVEEEEG